MIRLIIAVLEVSAIIGFIGFLVVVAALVVAAFMDSELRDERGDD
jgi:hypothetical protein